MGIIKSVLDTDLYKFTTSFAYAHLYPRAYGEFEFVDRNQMDFPDGFDVLLRKEIDSMADLALTDEEEIFLRKKLPYLSPIYVDFLKGYRFNPEEVAIKLENHKLKIKASGRLYRITLWETPILATISELYYREMGLEPDWEYTQNAAMEKAKELREHNITFSFFGMRRRFSFDVEDKVTGLLKEHAGESFFGTSNVYFAFKHGLNVSGTHPHEWVQFHGAIYGYNMANYMSMEDWIQVYDGDLGTALTDTYTTDVFLNNFSKKHALLFTSLRHDSGDPLLFVEKVLKRYEELKVDPKTKYLVFSDSLNIPKVLKIAEYVRGRIGASFGIGTNLSNDVSDSISSLNIVMKLFRCKITDKHEWRNCIKLSDVQGKHTGSSRDIHLAKEILNIRPEE